MGINVSLVSTSEKIIVTQKFPELLRPIFRKTWLLYRAIYESDGSTVKDILPYLEEALLDFLRDYQYYKHSISTICTESNDEIRELYEKFVFDLAKMIFNINKYPDAIIKNVDGDISVVDSSDSVIFDMSIEHNKWNDLGFYKTLQKSDRLTNTEVKKYLRLHLLEMLSKSREYIQLLRSPNEYEGMIFWLTMFVLDLYQCPDGVLRVKEIE